MLLAALATGPVEAAPNSQARTSPATVAPGAPDQFEVAASSCPTFSWGDRYRAAGHEIVIYEVTDSHPTGRIALSARVPGGSSSWTPSARQCFEPGRYAWAVRSAESGHWSETRLFSVSAAPTPEDVRRALEVLEAYVKENPGATLPTAGVRETAPLTAQPSLLDLSPASATPSKAVATDEIETAGSSLVSGLEATVDSSAADSAAVRGIASSPTGFVYGVWGDTSSPGGRGVAGWSRATSGDAFGVHGRNTSPDGAAVFGWTTAATGASFGIEGLTSSTAGTAIIGSALAGSGTTFGVRGVSASAQGAGGLFTNTGGGYLLAANNQHSLTNPEFLVHSSGNVDVAGSISLGGDITCTDCIGASDIADNSIGADQLATDSVGADEIADAAVERSHVASKAIGRDQLEDRFAAVVECNGECTDANLASICGGNPRSPYAVACSNVGNSTAGVPCGGGDDTCTYYFLVDGSASLGDFCKDTSDGQDAIVFCLTPGPFAGS